MKRLVCALTLAASSIAFGTPKEKIFCELELSKHVRAASGLLATSLEKEVIQVSDLQKYLSGSPQNTPFSNVIKDVKSLDLMTAYNKIHVRLSPAELTELREAVFSLLRKKGVDAGKIAVAREETARVIAPRILHKIPLEPQQSPKAQVTIAMGIMNGRPIFSTHGSNPAVAGSDRRYFLDPFHPDSVWQVSVPTEPWDTQSNYIFTVGGQAYLAELNHDYFYNLTLGKEDRSILHGIKMNAISATREFALVESPRGVELFAGQTFDDPEIGEALAKINLSHSGVPLEVVFRGTVLSLRQQNVEGRDYLSFFDEKLNFYIYDVTAGMMLPVRATSSGMLEELRGFVFHYSNALHLAFVDSDRYLQIHNVAMGTMDRYKVESDFSIRGEINEVMIGGEPHLYYRSSSSLVLFNLMTRKFSKMPVQNSRFTDFRHFEWQGRTFMVWGSESQLQVYDLDSNAKVASVPMAGSRFVIKLFAYGREIYALVFNNNDSVKLVQITGRSTLRVDNR